MRYSRKRPRQIQRILTIVLVAIFILGTLPAMGLAQSEGVLAEQTEQPVSQTLPAPSLAQKEQADTAQDPVFYTVRFFDGAGTLLGEPQKIQAGGSAEAPKEVADFEGQAFLGWSTQDYLNVQKDLDVTALYRGVESAAKTFAVVPAAVQIIKSSDLDISNTSKEYGNPDPRPVMVGLPSNLVDGVDYYVEYTRTSGETSSQTYTVRVKTFYFINPNYQLQGNITDIGTARLTINKRNITITANSSSKTYDKTALTNNTYTVGGSGLAPSNTATVSVTGTQTNAGSSANTVGTVTIRDSGNNNVTTNYSITKVNGTLTVNAAPLLIKADNKSVNYNDAAPPYTISYSGFVGGDTSAILTTQPTASCSYAQGNAPGNYTINCSGAAAQNYAITYQSGTLTVYSSGVQITVIAASETKTYDGLPLVKNAYSTSGVPAGYTLTATIEGSITNVAQSGTGNNVVTNVVIRRNSDLQDVTAYFQNITKVAGNLSITPAPLTADVQDASIQYGALPPAYQVQYSGFVNGETASNVIKTPTAFHCSYQQWNQPGDYTITGFGATADNYAITYLPAMLHVHKNSTPITVTAASDSKVYSGTPLTNATYTVAGLPSEFSLEATVTGSVTNVAQSATGNNVLSNVTIKNASNETVTDYFSNITLIDGSLSITRAPLVVDVQDKAIQFNDAAPSYTVQYNGFVNGEDEGVLTALPQYTCTYTQGAAVGAYDITASNVAAANYSVGYLPGVLTVHSFANQVVVTAGSQNKEYDGVALQDNNYTYSGLPAGYTLEATVTGSATTVADSIPGNNKLSNIVIRNGLNQDVTANFTNVLKVDGTLSILAAPLVIKAQDDAIEFNDPAPVYTLSYSGFKNGENETVLNTAPQISCSYTQGDPVGGYSIGVGGAVAANYSISFLPGTLTVKAQSDQVTIVGGSANKVYDGTPLTNDAVTPFGLPVDYTVEAVVTGSVTNVSESGTANNIVSNIVIKNELGQDVTSNFNNIVAVAGNLTITPAPLTISAENKTIEFADAAPAYTLQYKGFKHGETEANLDVQPTVSCSYQQGDVSNTYPILVSNAAGANYTISYQQGELTVQKNSTQIVLTGTYASKVYSGTPLEANSYTQAGSLPAGYTFDEVVVEGSITNVSQSTNGNNKIKSYKIKNASNEEVTANFSGIVTVDGTLTITAATLLAQMDSQSIAYGSDPPNFTVTYTGFVPGEDSGVLNTQTVASCSYAKYDPVNTYDIMGSGATADNYSITYIDGKLQVLPYQMNITVVGSYAAKVYDGTPLQDNTFDILGTVPDGYTVLATVSGSATNVADSVDGNNVVSNIRVQNAALQDVTSNFSGISKIDGKLTITPAPLTIEADDLVIEYNDPKPSYPLAYHGFVNGEDSTVFTAQPHVACDYEQGKNPGVYPLTVSGAAAANYTIDYLAGTLTVKAIASQITITAGSASKQYDGTPLTDVSYTVDGLPVGYREDVTISGSAQNVSDSIQGNNIVTNVTIYDAADQDVTSNFLNIVKVPGTLSITRAPLIIKMRDIQIDYDSPAPTYTEDFNGFVAGEDETVLQHGVDPSCPYTKGDDMGTYTIAGSGAAAENYEISYQPGTLVVAAYEDIVTVVAASSSKTYDGKPLQDNSYTYHGLPQGYTLTAKVTGTITDAQQTETQPRMALFAVTERVGYNIVSDIVIKNSKGHTVTASFPNIVAVPGKLTILSKSAMIQANHMSKTIGEQDPVFTATVTGLVDGDTLDYTLERTPGEKVGTYTITPVLGNNPNYSITTAPGVLTIHPAQSVLHTIQSSAGPGGIISATGNIQVEDGGSYTFHFTPNPGYSVDRVFVDGAEVGTDGASYTFTDVRGDHSIQVTFKAQSVQTGDNSTLILWIVIAAAAAALIIIVIIRNKKKTE